MTIKSVLGDLRDPELWKFVLLVLAALAISIYMNPYLRKAGVPIIP